MNRKLKNCKQIPCRVKVTLIVIILIFLFLGGVVSLLIYSLSINTEFSAPTIFIALFIVIIIIRLILAIKHQSQQLTTIEVTHLKIVPKKQIKQTNSTEKMNQNF